MTDLWVETEQKTQQSDVVEVEFRRFGETLADIGEIRLDQGDLIGCLKNAQPLRGRLVADSHFLRQLGLVQELSAAYGAGPHEAVEGP